MEPGQNRGLIVPRVADQRPAAAGARHVFVDAATFDAELRALVELWRLRRPAAVDRLQVKGRRPCVRRPTDIRGSAERRARVERHIMGDELGEECIAGDGLTVARVLLVRYEPVAGVVDEDVLLEE